MNDKTSLSLDVSVNVNNSSTSPQLHANYTQPEIDRVEQRPSLSNNVNEIQQDANRAKDPPSPSKATTKQEEPNDDEEHPSPSNNVNEIHKDTNRAKDPPSPSKATAEQGKENGVEKPPSSSNNVNEIQQDANGATDPSSPMKATTKQDEANDDEESSSISHNVNEIQQDANCARDPPSPMKATTKQGEANSDEKSSSTSHNVNEIQQDANGAKEPSSPMKASTEQGERNREEEPPSASNNVGEIQQDANGAKKPSSPMKATTEQGEANDEEESSSTSHNVNEIQQNANGATDPSSPMKATTEQGKENDDEKSSSTSHNVNEIQQDASCARDLPSPMKATTKQGEANGDEEPPSPSNNVNEIQQDANRAKDPPSPMKATMEQGEGNDDEKSSSTSHKLNEIRQDANSAKEPSSPSKATTEQGEGNGDEEPPSLSNNVNQIQQDANRAKEPSSPSKATTEQGEANSDEKPSSTSNNVDEIEQEGNVPKLAPPTHTSSVSSINMVFIVLPVLALVISFFIFGSKLSLREACDMKRAENRDFNKYYGIINVKNHFTTVSADDCASYIIFKPALPQTILKPDHSASSFLTLAPYGTGKTSLRCEYYKSLRSSAYFKILILNKQMHEYLDRFVKEKARSGTDCKGENCIMKWSKNEFAQLLLSLLVTQFVHTFDEEQFNLRDIALAEKFEVITIICYYYNEQGMNRLEKFVNSFLKKTDNSMYSASKAEIQVKERHLYREKPLLTHLKNDLKRLSAVRQDEEKLHLLLAIAEGEGFQGKTIQTTMSDNVFNDLRYFAQFMKNHLKRTVVFIFDGIDENEYLSLQNAVNKKSLELFYRSSISEEILSASMAENFYLSMFYPEIGSINIQDAIVRYNNFPIHTINWNTKLLIDYADYIFREMNKNASGSCCKSLEDFKTLVNYADVRNAEIINQISTPRELHYFMQNLILEMNHCANDIQEPFIATVENIYTAYKNSYESFDKHDSNVE